jgi:uncharacterized membrane protein required for colicin V production
MMVDIYLILGISVFIVLGFRDGFSKKVFGFFGVWGGLIAAIKLLDITADLVSQWASTDPDASVAYAVAITLILSVIIVNLGFRWFGQTGEDTLSIRNRIAGAVLGGCQGLIAVSTVLILLGLFDTPGEEDRQSSVLYGGMAKIAPFVFDYSTKWIPSSMSFKQEMSSKLQKQGTPR